MSCSHGVSEKSFAGLSYAWFHFGKYLLRKFRSDSKFMELLKISKVKKQISSSEQIKLFGLVSGLDQKNISDLLENQEFLLPLKDYTQTHTALA